MQHTRSLFSIRRWGIVLAFLLFCLIPLTALGYSITDEASFNKLCKWCMNTDATLYDRRPVYDENGRETGWEFVPIGTIVSGKRVSSLAEIDGKYNIFYWSGGKKDAYVDPGTFSHRSRTVTSTTGRQYNVSDLAWGDEEAVRYVISEFYTAAETEQFIEGMRRERKGLDPVTGQPKKEGASSGTSSPKKKPSATPKPLDAPHILWKKGEETLTVDVKQAGTAQCIILTEGKEEKVDTAALSWPYEGEGSPLARVYAPRTGKATLYARDGGKGGALKKLDAGTVVLVLAEGEQYTKVYAHRLTGFVRTDALESVELCTGWQEGATADSVNFRLLPSKDSYRIRSLKKGSSLLLLSTKGEWACVEVDGVLGYVMTKYLK